MLTSENTHIIGRCDNCLCKHIVAGRGIGFSIKEKKLLDRAEGIDFSETNKINKNNVLACFVAFL